VYDTGSPRSAGGGAAAGYAGRKGKLASGTDILSSLNGLGEPDVLLVGGIFGVLGFLIHYCIGLLPVIGSAGAAPPPPATTDLPGITVFILAVVTRLAFGKTGLTGKYTGSGKREWFATGKGFVYNVVLGGGIGIVVSFIAAFLYENEFTAAFSIFPIVCFGFAAITLIFTQTGFATPATHHIFLPSGLAAGACLTAAFQFPSPRVGLPWPASPPGALRALCWACSSASWAPCWATWWARA